MTLHQIFCGKIGPTEHQNSDILSHLEANSTFCCESKGAFLNNRFFSILHSFNDARNRITEIAHNVAVDEFVPIKQRSPNKCSTFGKMRSLKHAKKIGPQELLFCYI